MLKPGSLLDKIVHQAIPYPHLTSCLSQVELPNLMADESAFIVDFKLQKKHKDEIPWYMLIGILKHHDYYY